MKPSTASTTTVKKTRKSVCDTDWELIERQFREGALTLREIGKQHDIQHAAISQMAKRKNWVRGIHEPRVQAKSLALANGASALHEITQLTTTGTAAEVLSDEQKEDASAVLLARVRLKHRVAIDRSRTLALGLMAELEQQTFERETFEKMAELVKGSGAMTEEEVDQMMRYMRGAMSTAGRIDSAKKLADALSKIVEMERTAFAMDVNPDKGVENAVAAFLGGLKRSSLPVVSEVPYIDMEADDAD